MMADVLQSREIRSLIRDNAPLELTAAYDFAWSAGGWLMSPYLNVSHSTEKCLPTSSPLATKSAKPQRRFPLRC